MAVPLCLPLSHHGRLTPSLPAGTAADPISIRGRWTDLNRSPAEFSSLAKECLSRGLPKPGPTLGIYIHYFKSINNLPRGKCPYSAVRRPRTRWVDPHLQTQRVLEKAVLGFQCLYYPQNTGSFLLEYILFIFKMLTILKWRTCFLLMNKSHKCVICIYFN